MKRCLVILLLGFALVCIIFSCKSGQLSCKNFRTGEFYFYSKTSGIGYKIIRDSTTQQEVVLHSNDTSFWRIQWIDDCKFIARWVSETEDVPEDLKKHYLTHITCIEILETNNDYYINRASLDSFNSSINKIDTVWLNPKKL
jgi:hypothetical protein